VRYSALILLLLLSAVLINVPTVTGGATPIAITPLKNPVEALPGDTVVIPFQIVNLGNETVGNVTVYVTGPVEGFIYQTKLIRIPIPPNGTINDVLSVKVLTVPPGRYNLTIVARAGSFYTQAVVGVKVGLLTDCSLDVNVDREYIYGHDVRIGLSVVSKSNGILLGTIGYSVLRDGRKLIDNESPVYLKPGKAWKKTLTLRKPKLGNYTVVLWTNLGGRFRKVVKTFRVYQRQLSYKAYFNNGAITVVVYNSSGGVPGIRVMVNGTELRTGDDGRVSYAVGRPGTYKVTIDLDGRIVTTIIEVRKLFINPSQRGSVLIVRVVDSKGLPVPNVTLSASGPLGEDYAVTNSSGIAIIDLNRTGYGTVILSAKSSEYLGSQAVVQVTGPRTSTHTPTRSRHTVVINLTLPQDIVVEGGGANTLLSVILMASGLLLAGTSYVAFATPIVHEEVLDRYYFIKVRAPRLRSLKNYRIERRVSALEVRATKGKARLEDGKLIWELDLEAGEEAYLQAVLG